MPQILLIMVVFWACVATCLASSWQLPEPSFSHHAFVPARAIHPKVRSEHVVSQFRAKRLKQSHPGSVDLSSHQSISGVGMAKLPLPEHLKSAAKSLSIQEAIALALRNNPQVKVSELQRVIDKFNLELAIRQYGIVWSPLTVGVSGITNDAQANWSAGTGISIHAPSGTDVSLQYSTAGTNLTNRFGNTTLQITQPLLRGFGFAYNRIPYEDAMDNEKTARLNFKSSVAGVVVQVIRGYRNLVASYNNLEQTKKSLKAQKRQLDSAELQHKVGKLSANDVLQYRATLAATQLSVIQAQEALRNTYLNFLSALGLPPSTNVSIDHHIPIQQVQVPSLQACIQTALHHNESYQQALIALQITKRALISAKNSRRWQLNVTGSVTEGSQLSSPDASNPTVGVSLSVPIDDVSLKAGVVEARINIEDAKMNLEQQKENLVRSVMNQWDSIHNQYQQIQMSVRSIQLAEKALKGTKLKVVYGMSPVFEENSLETSLLSQQLNMIVTKIAYLNAVTNLRQSMGIILQHWHVQLRY